jgi:stringent starvation protein B
MNYEKNMTPSRPYLIRGLYEWITDNGLTPYITVNSNLPNVVVPQNYVKDGKIVLNISQRAAYNLRVGNDAVEFNARFGGKNFHIFLPIPSIMAIFAQETSQGMMFTPKDIENYENKITEKISRAKTKKPHLKLIKSK